MKRHLFLLSLLICIYNNMSPADLPHEIIERYAKVMLSQEFYDKHLNQHKTIVQTNTKNWFPELYSNAIQAQNNGRIRYYPLRILKLYKATTAPGIVTIYPLFWLNFAQYVALEMDKETNKNYLAPEMNSEENRRIVKERILTCAKEYVIQHYKEQHSSQPSFLP